jgi:putative ABC transport system permease protein
MRTVLQELRYAFRTLLKRPGFTLVAVLTLALGIGVNTSIFTMVSAFLLQQPSGRDPDRIAVISSVNPASTFQADAYPVSRPNFMAWRSANTVFSDMAAVEYRSVNLSSQGTPEAFNAQAITPNYFDLVGIVPALGRTFAAGDDEHGRDHVVILSNGLWQRRFGSDPSVIGRAIRLNRENYTVVGVIPADFHLLGLEAQLWIPLAIDAATQNEAAHKDRSLTVFGRFKPDASLAQARAEFAAFARRAEADFPQSEKAWGAIVRTLPDYLIYTFEIRSALAVLMTSVGFVLMIACANVAGLLLARGAGRRKELSIRVAIGASRWHIVRQLLVEGLVLALVGGAFGLLFAVWGVHFIRANMNFNEAIAAVRFNLDWKVLLFALGVSFACALLCGLIPALKAARTNIDATLREQGRGSSAGRSQQRTRTVMVTAEIAMALFLLIGTGLLIRSIMVLHQQKLGFQPDHLLTAGLTLDEARYRDATQRVTFVREVFKNVQQLPGVVAMAAASDLPATGSPRVSFRINGQPELPANERSTASDAVVTADYLQAASISLLRGRSFAESDNASAPRVYLVNQEFVRRYFHDAEALGQQILLDRSAGTSSDLGTIVGVVNNVKSYSEDAREDPAVYESFLQRPLSSFSFAIRTTADPSALASSLRAAVAQVDSELPLTHVMSMPAVIERQRAGNPVFLRIMSTFALLALGLAAIGIYGLIAYSTVQRTQEFGIRMALGARGPDVLRMILWEGFRMTSIGLAIGLLLALPLPRLFGSIFVGIDAHEPRLYFIVPLLVLLVALLAVAIPARRATRVDPLGALRYE